MSLGKKLLFVLMALIVVAVPRLRAEEERPELEEIARLLSMRLALVREVAWSKANVGIRVADPAREAAVLASLKEQGRKYSMNPDQVSALFLPQIVASRRYQEMLLQQWRAGLDRPKTKPLDLQSELRPRIDRLDTELLRRWAAFPRDQIDDWSRAEAQKILCVRGIPVEVARIAVRPFG